jgi:RNA ligase
MSISKKYGRTYQYPFSPGTTSDDRINHTYWQNIQQIDKLIHTEKLDGENNCLSRHGVFARSHAAPTVSAWTNQIRQKWELIKNDLGNLEIFGENLFAIHSIEYQQITSHFYVFGVREFDRWLSWEETKFYAQMLDFETVPVIKTIQNFVDENIFKQDVLSIISQPSIFDSVDFQTQQPCTMEGIVSRNMDEYLVEDFEKNVFKYVRKGHVKTDEHWTRNWKRAKLNSEKGGDHVANN